MPGVPGVVGEGPRLGSQDRSGCEVADGHGSQKRFGGAIGEKIPMGGKIIGLSEDVSVENRQMKMGRYRENQADMM